MLTETTTSYTFTCDGKACPATMTFAKGHVRDSHDQYNSAVRRLKGDLKWSTPLVAPKTRAHVCPDCQRAGRRLNAEGRPRGVPQPPKDTASQRMPVMDETR